MEKTAAKLVAFDETCQRLERAESELARMEEEAGQRQAMLDRAEDSLQEKRDENKRLKEELRQLHATHDATVVELTELKEQYRKTKAQAEALLEKQKRFEDGLRNAAVAEPEEAAAPGEEAKPVDPATAQMRGAIAVLMDERAR